MNIARRLQRYEDEPFGPTVADLLPENQPRLTPEQRAQVPVTAADFAPRGGVEPDEDRPF